MKIDLESVELEEMRRFYEEELDRTVSRLKHLRSVLDKLGGSRKVNISVEGEPIEVSAFRSARKPAKKPVAPQRKRRKKRGRKSIWGEFILATLKRHNRPMKYSEIIQAAKMQYHLPDSKMKQLKAAINQSAFRLRTVHKKIDTVGEEGKKEKYIALTAWYTDKGDLDKRYAKFLK